MPDTTGNLRPRSDDIRIHPFGKSCKNTSKQKLTGDFAAPVVKKGEGYEGDGRLTYSAGCGKINVKFLSIFCNPVKPDWRFQYEDFVNRRRRRSDQ